MEVLQRGIEGISPMARGVDGAWAGIADSLVLSDVKIVSKS
jgi:hypothetical protein